MELLTDAQVAKLQKQVERAKLDNKDTETGNGWINLLAGFVLTAIFLANQFCNLAVITIPITVGLTLLWIISKESLKIRSYKKNTYSRGKQEKGWLIFRRIFLVSVALFVLSEWLFMLFGISAQPSNLTHLIIISASLIIFWRHGRSPYDFATFALLLMVCFAAFSGQQMALFDQVQNIYVLVGLVQIFIGSSDYWKSSHKGGWENNIVVK